MSVWQEVAQTLRDEFSDVADAAQVTRIVLRLAVAAALGGVLGLERERRHPGRRPPSQGGVGPKSDRP